ncbi:MAG TPA: FG-GAP-like repeat-containing protein, partial [Verrucomicrobiae bacterium]|nr:FG-GAP-like repeat-containing protein [Verrucomicrobiae bacterium]
ASPHVRQFLLLGVSGFIFESRNNNTQGAATTLSLSPTNSPDGSFLAAGSFATGTGPYFVIAGLVNGDASLDLITANNGSDNVSVLLGNGDGTFQPATNFAAGNGPIALALGAVNNDANADLVVANNAASSVGVLLGNGSGTFGVSTNFSVGSGPRSVKLGDFNGDGKLDFVTANSGSANVSVALGNGDGSFGPRTNFATAGGSYGVAIADFDADGRLDLAVANQNADNVSVLRGNGDGSFGAATHFAVGNGPRSLAAGDLDGDSKLDLAVISAFNNAVNVLRGNGDGTFGAAVNYATGGSDPYQIILADLNGDGDLDVSLANYGSSRVGVMLNRGDGTLSGAANFTAGNRPISVAAGDFDNNGRLDLATANHSGHNVTILFPNDSELLVEDPAGSGVRTSWGRGNVSSTSDFDYWSFTANAGDLLTMASDVPGNPSSSGLYFRIDAIDGTFIGDFYSDANGRGESQPFSLPFGGTYTVRVSYNYQYFGEYRFRLTLARPPMQIESEGNNLISQADAPVLAVAGGHQTATVLGYVSAVDPGDYFRLGNLAEGTLITLGASRPVSSGLLSILGIYHSSGSPVAFSAVRGSNVAFTVPPAAGGTYYARVFSDDFSVAGQFGGTNGSALRFDGGSAHASAADSSSLRPANVTLEGWFNFAAVGGVRSLIGRTLGAADNNSYVLWHDSGQLRGGVGDPAGFTLVNGVWSPQLDAWYHLAYVFDDAANAQMLYVNGALLASNTVTRTIGYDTHPVLVGADIANGNPAYFFAGKADEVRVWSVARTQAQIAAAMEQSLVGNEAGLAGYWRFDEGTGTSAADATANANHGTLVNLPVWAPSGLANPQPAGLSAQYILSIDLADTLPPAIVSNNLPAEGSTNAIIVDRFALGFSEDMLATSVTNSGSYDLRAAGADNIFDTPDDAVYAVECTGYTSGLSASYLVTDGPLQAGRYRFTATTALQDRLGNALAAPHVRQFALANVAGFVFESRNNNSAPTATSLSTSPLANPDGSFATGNNYAVGSNPYFVATGQLNADANPDVVTANNGSDNVSVLLGNGDATFQPATNYATGNGPNALALGDVNSDGKADIVVANNSANTVSVLPGNGNGSFQPATHYSVGTSPRSIKLGDLNGDGQLD